MRDIDARFGWMLRWITPLIVVAVGVIMIVLKDRFYTRAEAELFVPVPARVQQIERELEPLKILPSRVQTLEERAQVQALTNVRREGQIDEIKDALSKFAVQQSVANSKLDDINRRTARTEDKVDQLTRSN